MILISSTDEHEKIEATEDKRDKAHCLNEERDRSRGSGPFDQVPELMNKERRESFVTPLIITTNSVANSFKHL